MKKNPKKTHLSPESMMMSYGYKPELSEGALKCPIFQTSTFVFKNAEEGKAFFEIAYGLRGQGPTEELGLIYSRLNNPDLEILEDRLTLWEEVESCAVFESGLAAISTTLFEFLRPGDILLHSEPIYGGTDYFFKHVLTRFNIQPVTFIPDDSKEDITLILDKASAKGKLAMIFIETPANPTNSLIDMEMCAEVAKEYSTKDKKVLVAVDNTFLGPLWQKPVHHGADLILYSATKYLGGHSDLIAGACLGSKELINRVRALRIFMGTMLGPWTGWLLMRSLETLKLRMTQQVENAQKIADHLSKHPLVDRTYYLGLLKKGDGQYEIYKKQCLSPGAMVSFDIKGGEENAFKFLNGLQLIKIAVSLGGTESLAEHPASMTHSDIDPGERNKMNITDQMIRLSVGVEHIDDLIKDIDRAFEGVGY